MNEYKIITVGFFIKKNNILNISMNSNYSLLDGDIIIINPGDTNWIDEENKYKYGGLNLEHIINNKTREISTLLKYGKIIVVFSSPVYEFESKKGYNDPITITNYDFLPEPLKYHFKYYIIKGAGSRIKNYSKEYLSDIYKTYENNFKYYAYISENFEKEDNEIKNCLFKDFILRNKTDNLVGFAINIDKGNIFFIPYIISKDSPERIVDVVIKLCRPFLEKDLKTPEPEWCKDRKFFISGEKNLENRIKKQNNRINVLNKKVDELILRKNNLTDFRKLLYEKGPQLERVVRRAFEVIGFNVSRFEKEDMEHDIILESEEGRIIGEIEGKDNDAIHINKLDQLISRVIDEDFKNKGLYPEGILIGNAYRMKLTKERKKTFHDKVIISAKRKNIGLISTVELFKAVKKILSSPNNNKIKKEFRVQIVSSLGKEIKFK